MTQGILETFNQLEATRSPLEKMDILKACTSPIILKKIMVYALHPDKVYGIKKLGDVKADRPLDADEENLLDWFALLDALESRKWTGREAVEKTTNQLECMGAYVDICKRILLKDLRCGVAESLVNKVWPDLIRVPRASKAEEWDEKRAQKLLDNGGAWVEEKYEGKRITAFLRPGQRTELKSYEGKPETGYDVIRDQCDAIANEEGKEMMLDMELMFNMFGKRANDDPKAVAIVFDLMKMHCWDAKRCLSPQSERTRDVQVLLGEHEPANLQPPNGRMCYTMQEVNDFYEEIIARKGEGIVVKDPNAPYAFDRSWDWIKKKSIIEGDFMIEGYYQGEPGKKFANCLGGFTVIVTNEHRGDTKGNVPTNVGGGFTDEQRKEFWENRDNYVGKTMKVEYNMFTPNGLLRLPVFVEMRDDK